MLVILQMVLKDTAWVVGPNSKSSPVCLNCLCDVADDGQRCDDCHLPLCADCKSLKDDRQKYEFSSDLDIERLVLQITANPLLLFVAQMFISMALMTFGVYALGSQSQRHWPHFP